MRPSYVKPRADRVERIGNGTRLKKIGLTGGIGSGKSLVLGFLAERGFPVLQTDKIGHRLLRRRDLKRKLSLLFGRSILGQGGAIDRARLARDVFSDPVKRKKLERLLHPAIRREVSRWVRMEGGKPSRPALAVVEVPLLFEGGYHRWFDGTVCVSSSRSSRRERLRRRGWSLAEIRKRERSQWSQARKNRAADWVIFNPGSLKGLKYAVDRWLRLVL